MRSTGIAWLLLVLIAVGVIFNSVFLSREIQGLREKTEKIDTTSESVPEKKTQTARDCHALGEAWDRIFPYLTYVCSYAELNRADEAMMELLCAMETEQYEDAVTAKAKLLDALRRLYELESFSFGAVF